MIPDPYDYAEAGIGAPEPVEHDLTAASHPGRHGERPEPASVSWSCVCGADIADWIEGRGSLGQAQWEADAAFLAHLEEVEHADR